MQITQRQAASGRLKAQILPVKRIADVDRDRMFELMQKYYESVERVNFDSDLDKKNDVIILRDTGSNEVKGFSTLLCQDIELEGENVKALFSGDTIVEREYWGQKALQRAFARYILFNWFRYPLTPFYWMLISKGYKTYLLLSNNFLFHYPRYEEHTPSPVINLMNRFYGDHFARYYEPATGLIRFTGDTCRLKKGVAEISPDLLQKHPRIRFFQEKNPEWTTGTELACVARITCWDPLLYLARVVLREQGYLLAQRGIRFIHASLNRTTN